MTISVTCLLRVMIVTTPKMKQMIQRLLWNTTNVKNMQL